MTDPIFVPLPDEADWISLNERTHWRPRSRKTKAWREAAHDAALNHPNAFGRPVDLLCEVHKPSKGPNRRWDPNNLFPTLKACIDGLVDAYVLKDDDTAHVRNVAIIDGGRRDTPGITITITPTGA